MLQRAASNAYSWWWASHVRTKQGKWLEQSLQDMEEKVKNILKIIEEDADSFAKRAEMYYRQRPELISFVEDSYKAYRALAERYEHMSGELQNANKTIATIFPDQVPLDLDDDDESSPMVPTIDPRKVPKAPENPKFKISIKDMKSSLPSNQKKTQANTKRSRSPRISKEEAQKGIDKLQKGILVLQTEKEYVKSSYESGFARYWEIEKEIEDMQEKICSFQDEVGADMVIEDNDARALMTASALKSCEDTLLQLQEQQNRSKEEAQIESKRVKDAEERLKVFKKRYLQQHVDDQKIPHEANIGESSSKKLMEEICTLKQERLELQSLCEKVKEYFEMNSNSSLAVMDLAEKIDELVNEVHSLGSTIVSQTSLIKQLRSETNEFQKNLQSLEEDKMSIIEDSKKLSERVKELEEELHDIQDLDRSVEDQRNKFQTNFTETCCVFDNISETLRSPKKEEGVEITGSSTADEDATNLGDMRGEDKIQGTQDLHLCDNNKDQENHPQTETCREPDVFYEILTDSQQEKARDKNSFHAENTVLNTEAEAKNEEQTGSPNWQQLFLDGLQDREKALLTEYTTILRNYKETKKKLCEVEKENQDSLLKIMTQIEELKSSNVSKDEEIQSLRQKLNILETNPDENMNRSSKKSGSSTYAVDHWKILFSEFQKTRPNHRLLVDLLKEQNIDFATRARESSVLACMKSSLKEGDSNLFLNNQQHASSNIEEKFRRDIDELLEENLKFWLRFSISFNQIQKFHKEAEDLQEEFSNMNKDKQQQEGSHKDSKKQEGSHKDSKKQEGSHKDRKKQEGSHKDSKKQEGSHKDSKKQEGSHKDTKKQEGSSHKDNRKQEGSNKDSKKQDGSNHSPQHVTTFEAISIEKNLRDLQAELSTWLEQNALLKEELECRFESLCSIQEEISRISKLESETGGEKITAQQTAKFQGEVLNMQQENNKVAEELQAGLDHVRGLQFEIEKTLSKLNESFDMSGSKNHGHQQNHMMHSTSRGRGVPLRSFLFGAKPKKQSIFACVNPAIQKHFNEMRAAGRAFPM